MDSHFLLFLFSSTLHPARSHLALTSSLSPRSVCMNVVERSLSPLVSVSLSLLPGPALLSPHLALFQLLFLPVPASNECPKAHSHTHTSMQLAAPSFLHALFGRARSLAPSLSPLDTGRSSPVAFLLSPLDLSPQSLIEKKWYDQSNQAE